MMLLATATELITLYIALELSALPMVALAAGYGAMRLVTRRDIHVTMERSGVNRVSGVNGVNGQSN